MNDHRTAHKTRGVAGTVTRNLAGRGQTRGLAALAAKLGARGVAGECLANHTTFGIGGPADLYVETRSRDELIEVITLAHESSVPCLVIGGGANLLVADKGVRGLVVRNASERIEFRLVGEQDGVPVEVDSGCLLKLLAQQTMERGLTGLEWAVDVPGTVGGAVVGNAGAFGGYTSDSLTRALILDPGAEARWWSKGELEMGYRTSCLKERYARGMPAPVVLAAEFLLRRGDPAQIRATADKHQHHRKETQPAGKSAGSVFKRTKDHPAGYLIENAGLKGSRVGDAVVSDLHANFILNLGAASAEDVRRLIDMVRIKVHERYGVWLELEIQLVGEW